MIMAWMLKSFLGVPRWMLVLAGIALLLIGLFIYIGAAEEADDRRNQEIGAAIERQAVQEATLERVEKANEAREQISRDATVRYQQCLRTARTPANCQRFLPERPAD